MIIFISTLVFFLLSFITIAMNHMFNTTGGKVSVIMSLSDLLIYGTHSICFVRICVCVCVCECLSISVMISAITLYSFPIFIIFAMNHVFNTIGCMSHTHCLMNHIHMALLFCCVCARFCVLFVCICVCFEYVFVCLVYMCVV